MITGIGTDLIEMARVEQVGLDRLAARILSKEEKEFLPTETKRKREFVSGRFAAKEAVAKAMGTGIGKTVGFRDISVIPDSLGRPIVHLSQVVVSSLKGNQEVRIHLSITHTREYAAAFAVLEEC